MIFIINKYTQWYCNIIEAAKARPALPRNTTNRHHILPKAPSMWPEYANFHKHPWNGVYLTHREHFICHWLLTKMTTGKAKCSMLFALHAMTNKSNSAKYVPCSRIFALVREQTKTVTHTSESIAKMSESMKGKGLGVKSWNSGMQAPDWHKEACKKGRERWRKEHPEQFEASWRKARESVDEAARLKAISKPVIIDGIEYPSAREAYRQLNNIKYITLIKRIESINFPNYNWVSKA
jgi:hypothetical protein